MGQDDVHGRHALLAPALFACNAAFAVVLWGSFDSTAFYVSLALAGYCVVALAALRPVGWLRRVDSALGDLSYPVFLVHQVASVGVAMVLFDTRRELGAVLFSGDEAEKRIGHIYPQVEVTEQAVREEPLLEPLKGQKLTVIAWLWARTVASPNPAAKGAHVPLVSSFMLSAMDGKKAWVEPVIDASAPDGYQFVVRSGRIAKEVFDAMWESGKSAAAIVADKGLKQISDTGAIEAIVAQVIADNPGQAEQFRSGNEKILGWFVGQVMKASQGKANPGLVNQILRAKLS